MVLKAMLTQQVIIDILEEWFSVSGSSVYSEGLAYTIQVCTDSFENATGQLLISHEYCCCVSFSSHYIYQIHLELILIHKWRSQA